MNTVFTTLKAFSLLVDGVKLECVLLQSSYFTPYTVTGYDIGGYFIYEFADKESAESKYIEIMCGLKFWALKLINTKI